MRRTESWKLGVWIKAWRERFGSSRFILVLEILLETWPTPF